MQNTKYLYLTILLLFVLGVTSSCSDNGNLSVPTLIQSKSTELKIGTGGKTGAYYAFGKRLQRLSSEQHSIQLVNTNGSVDNLKQIAEGKLDAAIVQNDIAYKEFSGRNDTEKHKKNKSFQSALPLFNEYLFFIVKKSSDILNLADLKFKDVVWAGKVGSGTRNNAIRVIDEMGMRQNIQIPTQKTCDFPECLTSGKMQAAFFTRASPPKWFNEESFRIIGLPTEVLNRIVTKTPYFHKVKLPANTSNPEGETLSVLAYLVLSKSMSTRKAESLIDDIINNYKKLKSPNDVYQLLTLKDYIAYLPATRHPGVVRSLVEHKLIADPSISWWLLPFVIALIALLIWSHKHSIAYDMLGCKTPQKNFSGWILKQVNIFYIHAIIIISALALIASALWFVRIYEDDYAIENNTQSTLSDISFSDALIWMFVFMGSGYAPENEFPKSTPGKLLVTTFPLIGFASLIGLIGASYSRRRDKMIQMRRGNFIPALEGHVLICGWNEKAPGIVYGLTCKDAPAKRKVVVIAELGTDSPLAKYDFNHRLVSYCNGDSADMDALSRAHVNHASEAIILAGLQKRHSKNIRSVLTALALKRRSNYKPRERIYSSLPLLKKFKGVITQINKILFNESPIIPFGNHSSIFVITELLYKENKERFDAANTDAILDSEVFSNRLVSSSCLGSGIVDFIMDIVTHDEFSEIYMVQAEVLTESQHRNLPFQKFTASRSSYKNGYSWAGWSLNELRAALLENGVNLIGVKQQSSDQNKRHLDGLTFDDQGDIKLVFKDPNYKVSANDQLLFLAEEQSTFTSINSENHAITAEKSELISSETNQLFTPRKIKVLAIGSWRRCKSIQKEFAEVDYVDFFMLTSDVPEHEKLGSDAYYEPDNIETCWDNIPVEEFDRIIILANNLSDVNQDDLIDDKGELDAPTLFIANNIKKHLSERKVESTPRIIAEMQNYRYRSLFEASVDIVIPSSMFIERLLIKGIYHHGDIGNFLSALLAEQDGTYLMSYTVQEDDCFHKKNIKSLFNQTNGSIQVLGYHPASHAEAFVKAGADFNMHFAVSPVDLENVTKQYHKKQPESDVLDSTSLVGVGDVVTMIYTTS